MSPGPSPRAADGPAPKNAARAEILGRIGRALVPAARGEHSSCRSTPPTAVDRQLDAPLGETERVARFVERVEEYRATVCVVEEGAVPAAVRAICARHAVSRLAVPDGVPDPWIPGGMAILAVACADAQQARALDAVDGVLTSCALAVAETGTIMLDGGPGQGPRAATLLPDLHICVVDAGSIVPGVGDLVVAMEVAVRAHGRPLTLVSGPSATSDIELERVEGVHGPRRLEIVVVTPANFTGTGRIASAIAAAPDPRDGSQPHG